MQLKKAERKQTKLRVGVFGPSGSGKTYTALLLASGMAPWEKIAVIDTERGSADLYSDLGDYNTLTLEKPFSPEKYIEAIAACEEAGMEVIIIDSISHEWEYILDEHDKLPGNSFTNWAKFTPRHNRFIDRILQSRAHVICCGRVKQDYVLVENSKGKQEPQKVGLKATTREGFDYEMTLCFDLDIRHNASASKDRTSLFIDQPASILTAETGARLIEWVRKGKEVVESPQVSSILQPLVKELSGLVQQYGLTQGQIEEITGFETFKGLPYEEFKDGLSKIKNYVSQSLHTHSNATTS